MNSNFKIIKDLLVKYKGEKTFHEIVEELAEKGAIKIAHCYL